MPNRTGQHSGRRQSSVPADESLLAFTGGVICLLRAKRHVAFSNLFPLVGSGNKPRYYPTHEKVFAQLVKSGFPPAMMATAICELVPLNYLVRGGPDSASRGELKAKAKARVLAKSPAFDRIREILREDDYSQSEIEKTLNTIAAEPEAARNKTMRGFLMGRTDDSLRHLLGLRESQSHSSKGTPVHRVPFIGASISRAMASYWRNHRQFKHCKPFLRKLLPFVPANPYPHEGAIVARLASATFVEGMKMRRLQRERARTV
jgi:hypothetical protein